MSSIIERPWSEDGFRDVLSGIENGTTSSEQQSNQKDSYMTTLQGSMKHPHADDVSSSDGTNFDSPEVAAAAASRVESGCTICHSSYHKSIDCNPGPLFVIVCQNCGTEMKNDQLCPQCKRETIGFLMPELCDNCDRPLCYHTGDSCPSPMYGDPDEPDDYNRDDVLSFLEEKI